MSNYSVVEALEQENIALQKHIEKLEKIITELQSQLRKEENKNSKLRNERNILQKQKHILMRIGRECEVDTIKSFVDMLKDSLCLMVDHCDETQLFVQWDDVCELAKKLTEGSK